MRFVDVPSPGGPEAMVLKQGPAPLPKAGEVQIQVQAAGVNRPDLMQRAGLYPPPHGASAILGLEVAGVVTAVSDGVRQWAVGDRVCALTNGGGYAELVTVPAGQCLPVPRGLDFVQAASLPETFFTVWSNVFDRGGLQAGETLLVHGGSSGIGSAAIQMAKARQAQVIVTAGTDDKCDYCLGLGADLAINYKKEDFVQSVKTFTHRAGADVILDMVGGDYVARNLAVAATDGCIINIAFQKGSDVKIDLMRLMMKRLTLTGSTLRARSAEDKTAIAAQLHQHIWPLLENGQIKPQVHKTFPLSEVGQAHRTLECGGVMGKLVLNLEL